MNNFNIVIFPVIFFFLNTSPKLHFIQSEPLNDKSQKTIYFIKQRWHTAVVFQKDDIDSTILPEVNLFTGAQMIDVGWGDEEFYQYPGFDWELAAKALFYATPSTLRVEGIYISKQQFFDVSEIVVELKTDTDQLKLLQNYIAGTVWRDSSGNPRILSSAGLGRIYFLKANGSYHLFNTCNTWLAKGLKLSGFDIKDDIILTEQLFNELSKIGNVIKVED